MKVGGQILWNVTRICNGVADTAVRRVEEGTSAVLLQSGLDEKWWQISWDAIAICETFNISCLMERHFVKGDSEYHLMSRYFC